MEQQIIHVCGHGQAHHLTGHHSQQERKARWLKTTICRDCFVVEKRAEAAATAALSSAAVMHLGLPVLTGTDRQINWASTIRAKRLAAITALCKVADYHACLQVTEAKWWIDHRDITDVDMISAAGRPLVIQMIPVATASIMDAPQVS